jgi:hypothetical protein
MKQLLAILFAAGFTYTVSLAAGKLLLQLLRTKLSRMESNFIGFLLGAACLSTIIFFLTAAGAAYAIAFLFVGLAIISLAIWRGAFRFPHFESSSVVALPAYWKITFGILYTTFGILYLGNALLPEHSPDGTAYHIAFVARYFREHHFPLITTTLYAGFPEGVEMLFLFAYAFGKHTAAAMVHLLFTMVTPFGMLAYGRRIGAPAAGVVGALLFFISPVVGKTGSSAYVDVAMAAVLIALFLLLEIWRTEQQKGLLVAIGLMAGFAYTIKYSAGLAIPYAIGCVVFHQWRARKPCLRPAVLVASFSLLLAAPWMIKNFIFLQNPVLPFASRFFPNPYFSDWLEKNWERATKTGGGVGLLDIPLEITIGGGRLLEVLGPVFLLSPLLLFGLKRPAARRLILAALLFAIPYVTARETRYLVPSLTFVSLGMALVLTRWNFVAVAVVLLHAFASWPPVLKRYVHPYAWRLQDLDWKAVLRLTPEADFLRRKMEDYDVGLMIDKTVPAGEPVLAFATIQQAYHSHEIIVAWTSSFGNRITEVIRTPIAQPLQPTRRHDYRFPPIAVRKLRLTQTARSETDRWSLTELHIYHNEHEIPRVSKWRLKASSNPWDVAFAFDNSAVTRWASDTAYQPGMYVEVNFEGAEEIDRVVADCTRDQEQMRMRLDTEVLPGRWQTILETGHLSDIIAPQGMRASAVQELERNHIHWLLIRDKQGGADDYYQYQNLWGIRLVAATGLYKLYHLE